VDADGRRVEVAAGTSFRTLAEATLPAGLLPEAMPLNLDLTVGGVLSAGGIGSTAHRFGLVAGTVESVEVVTGTGEVVRASAAEEPGLFAAVLGGLGRCGVITSAVLRLRPAGPRVRTAYLLYDDPAQWVADQRLLVERGGADQLEAMCSAAVQGFAAGPGGRRPLAHWLYGVHITAEGDGGVEPDLDGLSPWRVLLVDEDSTLSFLARYDGRFAAMRATGTWDQPHPWFECLLPGDQAAALVPEVLAALPLSLGDGHRLLWVDPAGLPPLVARPEGEPVAAFAVLPTGVPEAVLPAVLDGLGRVWELLDAAGAKRYLSGYLGSPDEAWWRRHFGPRYDQWAGAKAAYDPDGVFCSALFPPAAG
jgi:cytokinin dehydrogenase